MGRAGRGGGGGGSRGGGFGGSRGFGSHSGSSSHRSGYSSSRSSSWSSGSHSSYHRRYNSGPRFYYFGGSRYNSGYSGGYKSSSGSSGASGRGKLLRYIIWGFIILSIISSLAQAGSFGDEAPVGGVTKSTVDRQKLESSSLVVSDQYFYDGLDWIKDPMTLKSGMTHFYETTGVQPFLYITDDVDGSPTNDRLQKFTNEVYDNYFKDEAHLVVLFYEKNGSYKSCYVTGLEAKTVVDDEAGEILLDYIDHYYYSDYDEATFFSKSFSEAADRMMRITPSYGWIALIFVLVLVIVIVLFVWWRKKKKHKLDQMKQAQDILNSDLNEFGSSSYTAGSYDSSSYPGTGYGSSSYSGSEAESNVEELKKKYDN